jgi:16S rRNA (guanine(966)-N(2))-methyltransferase RsmD
MHDIEGADVLDLFAGSGALGIEAISRGAETAVFVESGKDQINIIEQNLKSLGLELSIIPTDFQDACTLLNQNKKQFDLIFADPPYEEIQPQNIIDTVNQYNLLRNNGLLIIEHKFGQPVDTKLMKVLKKRKFGQTEITFLCGK